LIGLAVWQIAAANSGVRILHFSPNGLPMSVLIPEGSEPGKPPLVLIGHGFAGSDVLMRGFALTLAKAGYVVASWDFDGHGANPRPWISSNLIGNAETALAEVQAQGLVDVTRVAILGHSMGSGVALEFGQVHPETKATIAISPVGRTVTPQLPHNLLLMAGSLEGSFVSSAQLLLEEAGGAGGDPANGTARQLTVIPGVEHVSILFSPQAHQAARAWLDATFGLQPGAENYRDRRIIWYGIGVLGTILAGYALTSLLQKAIQPVESAIISKWVRVLILAAGALGASLILWLASKVGLDLRSLLGILVGGYMLIWFGVAGLITLVLSRFRLPRPSRQTLLEGLLVFVILWLGVGLLGSQVWLPWLLIGPRLVWWPLGGILLLPWFLSFGELYGNSGPLGRFGLWLLHSLLLVGGFFLAMRLNPDLGFIMIILPLFPIVIGLHALATAHLKGSWSFALSGALFTTWLLLAVFPLQ